MDKSKQLRYIQCSHLISQLEYFNTLRIHNKDEIDEILVIIGSCDLYNNNIQYNTQKLYNIEDLDTVYEDRIFATQTKFIKTVDQVMFSSVQHINSAKAFKSDMFKFTGVKGPHQLYNKKYIIMIEIVLKHIKYHDIQIVVQLNYMHQQGLILLNTQEEVSTFKESFKTKKDNICSLLQEGQWDDLFNTSEQCQVVAYITVEDSKQSDTYLDKRIIQIGLEICQHHDPAFIEVLLMLQQIFNKRELTSDTKRLLKNPINISKSAIIKHYPWNDFIVSPKADGQRTLLIQKGKEVYILYEKNYKKLQNSNFEFNFIIEAEKIQDQLLSYDVHQYGNTNCQQLNQQERIGMIADIIQMYQKQLFGGKYKLLQKSYAIIKPDTSAHALKQIFERLLKQDYEVDGLILSSNESVQTQIILKWKPLEKLSIDLYCQALPKHKLSEGFTIDNMDNVPIGLFTHISKEAFREKKLETFIKVDNPCPNSTVVLIPFQPSLCSKCYIFWRNQIEEEKDPLSGKVCEFSYNTKEKKWILLRVRTDKDPQMGQFGNYLTAAEAVFTDIINYIDISNLYDVSFKNQLYFQIQAPLQYKAMTQFINNIKRSLIGCMNTNLLAKHSNLNVLDIGAGKGQDINKYAYIGVKKLICIDSDVDAIQELIIRKLNTKIPNFPIVVTHILDINQQGPIIELLQEYKTTPIHIVSMHLMIHYIMKNIESISQLFDLVPKGGFVSIVLLDGQTLFDKLITTQELQYKFDNQVKYQYTKLYKETTFLTAGQRIQLKLPFSTSLMEEELVNVKYLLKVLKSKGLSVFADFQLNMKGDYQQLDKKDIFNIFEEMKQLQEADMQHISLYRAILLKKN